MGCGSPFGGFVSPFVGFVGFCIWVFILFLQKLQWPVVMGGFGYGFTIERKERERFLGFREIKIFFLIYWLFIYYLILIYCDVKSSKSIFFIFMPFE